jgi:hypothetical protein
MGGMNTEKRTKEERRKKRFIQIMGPRRRKRERERQIVGPAGDNEKRNTFVYSRK